MYTPCVSTTSAPNDFMRFLRLFTNGAPRGAAPEIMSLRVDTLYFATAVEGKA